MDNITVLALSPHTDDVELGCGGYLHKLKEQGAEIVMVAFSVNFHGQNLEGEWEESSRMVMCRMEKYDYEVRKFSESRQSILQDMVNLGRFYRPDMVLVPSGADIHQDHRVIHDEALRAFSRECSVLGYELPWNARNFNPRYFAVLSPKHIKGKKRMVDCYESQRDRWYFNWPFLEGMARMRGRQVRKEFAEAFEVITWID